LKLNAEDRILSQEYEKQIAALNGDVLYGDDFTLDQINQWFEYEKEGFYNLYYENSDLNTLASESYEFEELAQQHCFNFLKNLSFEMMLGIGSAHGAELKTIIKQCKSVTVLEPSDGFSATTIDGKPVRYVKPAASGDMLFPDNQFDLIVCFSVLHHIPNVSKVLSEIYRVLKPGGYVLVREPTHSLGDWRKPRRGLTKNERGIPLKIFRQIIKSSGFNVKVERRCMFSLMSRLSPLLGGRSVWTSSFLVKLDRLICAIPVWSTSYSGNNLFEKIRPTSVSYVLTKD
jgi:SAM-dependent methyltransferase